MHVYKYIKHHFLFFSKLTPDTNLSVQSFLTKIFHNLKVKPLYCFSAACPLYRNISISEME